MSWDENDLAPVYRFLDSQPHQPDLMDVTITEIEQLIGQRLPPESGEEAWWGPPRFPEEGTRGWKKNFVDLNRRVVTFARWPIVPRPL